MADQDRRHGAAELATAVAWPLFALIALLVVGGPLRVFLVRAGDAVAASSKVTVGSFSLEIQRAAASAGDPELGTLIRGLSSDALKVLLTSGNSARVSLSTPNAGPDLEAPAREQLAQAGLLKVTDRGGSIEYWLTPRGVKAFALILDAIAREAAGARG